MCTREHAANTGRFKKAVKRFFRCSRKKIGVESRQLVCRSCFRKLGLGVAESNHRQTQDNLRVLSERRRQLQLGGIIIRSAAAEAQPPLIDPITMKPNNPIPATSEGWLVEIAEAYQQAHDARRSGAAMSDEEDHADLCGLAPVLALRFRRLRRSRGKLAKASEAVLASYLVSSDDADFLKHPYLVFAFSYIASHHGLGMLTETEAADLMEYIERHRRKLAPRQCSLKPDMAPTMGTRLLRWLGKWGAG